MQTQTEPDSPAVPSWRLFEDDTDELFADITATNYPTEPTYGPDGFTPTGEVAPF